MGRLPKESTAAALKLAGVTVKTEESALFVPQSNGLEESAAKDAKDAVRTNFACLVRRFGREFPGGHPVYALACARLCFVGQQAQERSRRQDSL